MFLLLVAAAAIYFLLGDLGEASILLCSVLVMMAITVHQERRTERVLEALRDLTSPRALVVREGAQQRIPGRAAQALAHAVHKPCRHHRTQPRGQGKHGLAQGPQ